MSQQLGYWEQAHQRGQLDPFAGKVSDLARTVAKSMRSRMRILELGCGPGDDAVYFGRLGHHVVATDGSRQVITDNGGKGEASVDFQVQDMAEPLAFPASCFGIVYARLSLHYFTDADTREIVREVSRVLEPGGRFYFMCKSVDDRLYGLGRHIERDMFELRGHVRHFFSTEYARSLLTTNRFLVEGVLPCYDRLYGYESAFIQAVGAKI